MRTAGKKAYNAEYMAAWRAANPEKARERVRAWRAANREKENKNRRAAYAVNPEKYRERHRTWRTANLDEDRARDRQRNRTRYALNLEEERKKSRERSRAQYLINPEGVLKRGRAWRIANPEKGAARSSRHRARKLMATPRWLTKKQLQKIDVIYAAAQALSERSFLETYHVDHILPLQSRKVCGLHIPRNLQILTAEENTSKGNRLPPADQLVDYSAKGYAGVRAKLKRKNEQ